MEAMIKSLAARECLPIASQFYKRDLPREIRDMVYFHLVGPTKGMVYVSDTRRRPMSRPIGT